MPSTHDVRTNSPPTRPDLMALAWITALAVICRLAALSQPMRYDEAVTWALFAGRSWTTIVSWYPFPNNHVLHSLLAKATSTLAPWAPWALRLPAFVAGVAIVPLTWAVGKRYADDASALGGAALAAGSTSLVLYSANARGYSIVVALFLLLLLIATRVREASAARWWIAFGVVGAAGLYTIPVMLYPLGAVSLWLVLDAWRRPVAERRAQIARVMAAAGVAGLLAALLYLPIIRASGIAALADNRFVAGSTWTEFVAGLARWLLQTVVTWAEPFPAWSAPLVLLLALVGVRYRYSISGPSLAAATLSWSAVLLLATHRVPFVRVWLFMLPLYLIAVARGTRVLVSRFANGARTRDVRWTFAPAVLATIVVAIALSTRAAERTDDTGAFRGAREVTSLIAPRLRAGDRVLAPMPANGPLLYYFAERGLDTAALNVPITRAPRAFLVLDPARGQSLEWAIGARLLDPREFSQPVRLGSAAGAEVWETERIVP